jgi:hypothetical protein
MRWLKRLLNRILRRERRPDMWHVLCVEPGTETTCPPSLVFLGEDGLYSYSSAYGECESLSHALLGFDILGGNPYV